MVVRECLDAAVRGPFFPDWEFSTLFGLEGDEMAAVLAEWSSASDEHLQDVAVNNAMNMLLGYPHKESEETWRCFISVPPIEVAAMLARLAGRRWL